MGDGRLVIERKPSTSRKATIRGSYLCMTVLQRRCAPEVANGLAITRAERAFFASEGSADACFIGGGSVAVLGNIGSEAVALSSNA